VLVQEVPSGDFGLDGIEQVGEDGEEFFEGGLGPPDLFVLVFVR
jgi:hypothetical protein